MAVRSNLGNGVVQVQVTDTILFNPGAIDRYNVTVANVYNTTGGDLVLSVYVSPDLTSTNGDLVDLVTVPSGQEVDINAIVGQGYIAQNIIVNSTATGLNATLSRTEYTGGD